MVDSFESQAMPGLPGWFDYAEPYGVKNMAASSFFPSCMGEDSLTYRYFVRTLLQMSMAPAELEVPDYWSLNYVLYMLYCRGYGAVFYTDEYGIIFNSCTLSGYDINYQPKYVSIANPLLPNEKYSGLEIGKDAALIRLRPDYGSIMDTVCYYAGQLATAASSLNINLINAKLAYVFACDNKTMAESFKKLYDEIGSGKPAAFADKKLFDDQGNLKVQLFQQNLSSVFIGMDMLETMRGLMNAFGSAVGIPNANVTKRERLNSEEVNANAFETAAIPLVSEEIISRDIAEAIRLFPELDGKLSFRLRKEALPNAAQRNSDSPESLYAG
jgi:hypothetical protein